MTEKTRRLPRLRIRDDLVGSLVRRKFRYLENPETIGVYMGRQTRGGFSSALILVEGELRSFDPREWVVLDFEEP